MNFMVDWLSGIEDHRGWLRTAALLLFIVLTGCNSSKYLTNGEEILIKQGVELLNAKGVENKSDVVYELSTLARQKTNTNFLFLFPREYFYLANNKPNDSTRVDRLLRQTFGQPPTYYNDSLSVSSVKSMQDYLRYQGYFDAEVYHEAERRKHQVKVNYYARPGLRTRIKSITYSSDQPAIDSLLQVALQSSLLKKGEALDLNVYKQEQERISRFLRNQGYAFLYNKSFDQLEVDTFGHPELADVYLTVLPPSTGKEHVRYRIGNVDVYADYSLTTREGGLVSEESGDFFALDTIRDGVHFHYRNPATSVDTRTLLNNLFLRPGEYYSKADFDKSNQQLGALGIFRFVRINQVVDSLDEALLHYVVQLTPTTKMEAGVSLDVNYTNRSASLANNLIGLGLNPTFKNRNLFGGAQLLVANLRAGVEVDPNPTAVGNSGQFFNTIDVGADVSLFLPRFRDILGVYRGLYGKGNRLLTDRFYEGLRDRAETRFSLGLERLLILRYYSYVQSNVRFGYDFNISPTTRYQFNHAALDVFTPQTDSLFQDILDSNPFLEASFGEQYFLSMLFRDINYSRTGRTNFRGQSLNFNVNFEIAGWELFGINELVNAISGEDREFRPTASSEFAHYTRLRLDTRFNQKYSEQTSFASRFVLGIARPFGNTDAVPYVKQFSLGGANSMRAWAPRGLGPGGYLDSLSLNRSGSDRRLLYQTGDLMMELNLEYRYKIYSFFRGALFLDIGNVWALSNSNAERPGSEFRLTATKYTFEDKDFYHQPFYRQIAIGGGTGLRVDLSYFIFRVDISVPLRYNYPRERTGDGPPAEGLYWNNFSDFKFSSLTWQLGLGYPF